VLILELDTKGGVREQLRDNTWKLDQFFLRHSISRTRAGSTALELDT
jgi:hypothetical protein